MLYINPLREKFYYIALKDKEFLRLSVDMTRYNESNYYEMNNLINNFR